MFTGIITDIGTIAAINKTSDDWDIWLNCRYNLNDIAIGASIACSGICLTVVEKNQTGFMVQASSKTRHVSALGSWQEGERINLERALKIGDELGGHFVTGHVDGVAEVSAVTPAGDSHLLKINLPPHLAKFVAAKGSLTIDGVSLTVNDTTGNSAEFNIIPHSWNHTTLSGLTEGSSVNIEIDILARYLERMSSTNAK
jgi:riboflavin synthase